MRREHGEPLRLRVKALRFIVRPNNLEVRPEQCVDVHSSKFINRRCALVSAAKCGRKTP